MDQKLLYPIVIRALSEQEGSGFLAEVPDLPGCQADGETINQALDEVNDAIDAWIKTAEEFGDDIPRPSNSDQFSGQWRIRVPKSLHASLALHACREGVSLNLLAATLLAEGLGKRLTK